jgi:hypothetical protein
MAVCCNGVVVEGLSVTTGNQSHAMRYVGDGVGAFGDIMDNVADVLESVTGARSSTWTLHLAGGESVEYGIEGQTITDD